MIDGGCNNAIFLRERILHCLISYRQGFLLPVIQDCVELSCWAYLDFFLFNNRKNVIFRCVDQKTRE